VQRLSVLRRNHADEQYTARRKCRELPEVIARLERRLADLEADRTTAAGGDGGVVTLSGRAHRLSDAVPVLGRTLDRLPNSPERTRALPLGTYRGLAFGVERHPGGAASVYLEGRSVRQGDLSHDSQGPRAVLNALSRLSGSYDADCDRVRQDLALARNQLRDYEARLGRPFPQAEYLSALTDLRDRLKAALAAPTPPEQVDAPTPVTLAEEIKALQAANAARPEPVPEPPTRRRIDGEPPEHPAPQTGETPVQ
jgi:hypothetical protein